MITKEDLLQIKGIDPAAIDQILAKATDGQTEPTSLEALNSHLNPEKPLAKAKGEEGKEPDEDDKYDDEYMKKYMKQYMKKNPKEAAEAAKEAGLFKDELRKAIDELDFEADGGVINMVELKPVMEKLPAALEAMSKAISGLVESVQEIREQNKASYELMHKAAKVTAETGEIIAKVGNTSAGRKGQVSLDMAKAKGLTGAVDRQKIMSVLSKAVNNMDAKAMIIGPKYESSGMNWNVLNASEQAYVHELIAKEAN